MNIVQKRLQKWEASAQSALATQNELVNAGIYLRNWLPIVNVDLIFGYQTSCIALFGRVPLMTDNMTDKRKLRKNYYVSKIVQGGILRRLAVYWVLYHAMLWHSMFLLRFLDYRAALSAGGPQLTYGELYAAFASEHYSVLVCAAAIFPIILWDMLHLTHKVAGPLVRFRNMFRVMAQGERPERIRLRDGDLLDEFCESYNDFVDSVQMPANDSNTDGPEPRDTEGATSDDDFEQLLNDLHEIQKLTGDLGSHAGSAVGESPEPGDESRPVHESSMSRNVSAILESNHDDSSRQ